MRALLLTIGLAAIIMAFSHCSAGAVTGSVISVNPQCNNISNTTMKGPYCNVASTISVTGGSSGYVYWRQTTWTTLTLNAANGGGSYTASGMTA